MTTFSSRIIGGALGKYFIGSTWSCSRDDYDSLVWDSQTPNPKPTREEFNTCCLQYIDFLAVQQELYGYRLLRENDYNLLGSTVLNLLVAMLETMDGSKPQSLIDLQVVRAQVKAAYPKPDES